MTDVSLQELYAARHTAAKFALMNHAVLPVFERIEREIETREARMRTLARAAAVIETIKIPENNERRKND